jgi:lysophospholipase L1-like esterase
MITWTNFRIAVVNNSAVTIGVIGDSTSMGYGANPDANLWTNNLSYGYLNQPNFGPNWTAGDLLEILTLGNGQLDTITQHNYNIPGIFQLMEQWLIGKNASSVIHNYAGSGWTASSAVTEGSVALLAAQTPKPDVVFIAMGINSAKNGQFSDHASSCRILVNQCISNGMLPILVKEHAICAWDYTYSLSPDQWTPLSGWDSYINEMDVIAGENIGVPVINLYGNSTPFDITHMYDPFHPSNLGYAHLFSVYQAAMTTLDANDYAETPIKSYSGTAWATLVLRQYNQGQFIGIKLKKFV